MEEKELIKKYVYVIMHGYNHFIHRVFATKELAIKCLNKYDPNWSKDKYFIEIVELEY